MSRRHKSKFPAKVDLLERLVDPRLSGARCAGKSPWFDAELPDETLEHRSQRFAWARTECTRCPVQSACRTAAAEQETPIGVWAGRVHGHPGRTRSNVA